MEKFDSKGKKEHSEIHNLLWITGLQYVSLREARLNGKKKKSGNQIHISIGLPISTGD